MWVATSKGIDCSGTFESHLSTREGLATPEVECCFAAQDGTVWIGGADALDAIHPDGMSSVQAGKGLPAIKLVTARRSCGRLWVGVDNTMSIYRRKVQEDRQTGWQTDRTSSRDDGRCGQQHLD